MRSALPDLPIRSLLPLFTIAVLGTSCATQTQVSNQWISPDYTGGPMHKILVVGVTETDIGRRTYEDRFAEALRSAGAETVPSYQLLPTSDRLTKEELEGVVRRDSFDGVIVTRLLEVRQETTEVPPTTEIVPTPIVGYYGYYGMYYDTIHTPGYSFTSEIVRVETRLWNAADSKLVWGVTSETFDPTSDEDAIASITKKLASKLVEDGLVQQ